MLVSFVVVFFCVYAVPRFQKHYANLKNELSTKKVAGAGVATQTDGAAKPQFQNKKTTE